MTNVGDEKIRAGTAKFNTVLGEKKDVDVTMLARIVPVPKKNPSETSPGQTQFAPKTKIN